MKPIKRILGIVMLLFSIVATIAMTAVLYVYAIAILIFVGVAIVMAGCYMLTLWLLTSD